MIPFSSRKESFQRQEQDEFGNNRGMVLHSEYEKNQEPHWVWDCTRSSNHAGDLGDCWQME
jgi:hypothetical protein